MDKKFIWATTMNTEEGFAVAALDIAGSIPLHSEKETVDKITELLKHCAESYKKNFEAYNNALEMNTKSIVPDSVTYNYNASRITSDSKRTLQAMYTQEKVDSQYVTFYDRRSEEAIKKFRDMYKGKCNSIYSLIHTLKTKGIDADLCQWLPEYTKFFPIEVHDNPLVKEEPLIIKDWPEKKETISKKKVWTVTDVANNKVLIQTESKDKVVEALYLETCKNINYYTAMYSKIMQYYNNKTRTGLDYVEVWIDFEKMSDVILYRALKEVFKNEKSSNSRTTRFGTETKVTFSAKKSAGAIAAIANKYYTSMISFRNIRDEFFNDHETNPEDFARLIKAFADEGYEIIIK